MIRLQEILEFFAFFKTIKAQDVLLFLAVWVVEPLAFIVGSVVYNSAIGEFLVDFKELINVCTSVVILSIAVLRYRKNKKEAKPEKKEE